MDSRPSPCCRDRSARRRSSQRPRAIPSAPWRAIHAMYRAVAGGHSERVPPDRHFEQMLHDRRKKEAGTDGPPHGRDNERRSSTASGKEYEGERVEKSTKGHPGPPFARESPHGPFNPVGDRNEFYFPQLLRKTQRRAGNAENAKGHRLFDRVKPKRLHHLPGGNSYRQARLSPKRKPKAPSTTRQTSAPPSPPCTPCPPW